MNGACRDRAMIEYKGYVGVFEYSAESETFKGKVVNTRDPIVFSGPSVRDLKREMVGAVEAYLAQCQKRGRRPDKPYSGKFLVRSDSQLHRDVAAAASRSGTSMNEWVTTALREAVLKSPPELAENGEGRSWRTVARPLAAIPPFQRRLSPRPAEPQPGFETH
jgi:predicted HicB family RNase H-like nuclease